MTRHTFLRILLITCIAFFGSESARAQESGDAKIEALISHIGTLGDAKFIRNGSEYSAKDAAKFLRGKWQANKKDIKTPADFIEKAASKSSTTGKPYMIRFKDGKEVPCGDYLKGRLAKE
jgi:hypothetical protein